MAKNSLEMTQTEIIERVKRSRITIRNWEHFHSELEHVTDSGWIFRGVTSVSHYLIPSIGRDQYGQYKRAQEEALFHEFKSKAISIISDTRFSDWDWLAFAQHVGVPTRLLDWSTSPLIATFFALEKEDGEGRVLYCTKYSRFVHEVDHKNINPFNNLTEGRFSAPSLFDRIRAQRGLFTIHPDPTKIFLPPKLKSFVINENLVKDFRKRLFKYGIDFWHIYPDEQGLGQQLKWQFKNKIGLGSVFMKGPK